MTFFLYIFNFGVHKNVTVAKKLFSKMSLMAVAANLCLNCCHLPLALVSDWFYHVCIGLKAAPAHKVKRLSGGSGSADIREYKAAAIFTHTGTEEDTNPEGECVKMTERTTIMVCVTLHYK